MIGGGVVVRGGVGDVGGVGDIGGGGGAAAGGGVGSVGGVNAAAAVGIAVGASQPLPGNGQRACGGSDRARRKPRAQSAHAGARRAAAAAADVAAAAEGCSLEIGLESSTHSAAGARSRPASRPASGAARRPARRVGSAPPRRAAPLLWDQPGAPPGSPGGDGAAPLVATTAEAHPMLPSTVLGVEAAYSQGGHQPMVGPPAALRRMMEARAAALEAMVEEREERSAAAAAAAAAAAEAAASAASPRSPRDDARAGEPSPEMRRMIAAITARGGSPPPKERERAARQALGFNFVG